MQAHGMPQYEYTVLYDRKEDGNYNVVIPAIPQIRPFAGTLEDARQMAVDALRCHLERLIEYGAAVPTEPPTTPSNGQQMKEIISITL